eukprot:CAMPEP_0175618512 /NCGR_PEP_ID=MMETSP0096-20121207/66937_1 /TAXON_ID=311494 /ORGANISM="Alexandrium monilatum, Strain CCMP3105" /LENGTH=211 /DNA_ID=CAMNT_0016923711 /DNA_START=15 /DNA_END=648 /DNA_ORIENTATION=+
MSSMTPRSLTPASKTGFSSNMQGFSPSPPWAWLLHCSAEALAENVPQGPTTTDIDIHTALLQRARVLVLTRDRRLPGFRRRRWLPWPSLRARGGLAAGHAEKEDASEDDEAHQATDRGPYQQDLATARVRTLCPGGRDLAVALILADVRPALPVSVVPAAASDFVACALQYAVALADVFATAGGRVWPQVGVRAGQGNAEHGEHLSNVGSC